MTIIDVHAHVHEPCSAHVRLLDEAGIDCSVLLVTRVHPERARSFPQLQRELSTLQTNMAGSPSGPEAFRVAIEELHAALAANPERYIGFGTVPLGLDLETTQSWVENEIVRRGLRGIGELTPAPGRFEELLSPVLAAAADHPRLPVMVHGFAPTTAADLSALAALAARFPSVPIIISQLGGLCWADAVTLTLSTPNLFLDISTVPIVFAARAAIQALPERAMFGSDAPYGDPVLARQLIERVTSPGEARERILGGNAATLLGLI